MEWVSGLKCDLKWRLVVAFLLTVLLVYLIIQNKFDSTDDQHIIEEHDLYLSESAIDIIHHIFQQEQERGIKAETINVKDDKRKHTLILPPKCSGTNPVVKEHDKYDLLKLGPFSLLQDYKNPCWHGPDGIMKCIPYVYLAGIPKCGTTDLSYKLTRHPQIVRGGHRDHWITRIRFQNGKKFGFEKYFSSPPADVINNIKGHVIGGYNNSPIHPVIIGDYSTSTFWDNLNWPLVPGNENCKEPRITNAHMLYNLFVGTKIMVIFRNPTDRLFSDYAYFGPATSLTDFHNRCKISIEIYEGCKQLYGDRYCVNNISLIQKLQVRLHIGLYYLYMKEWLNVFKREQILDILFPTYINEPEKVFTDMFEFLEVAPLSQEELGEIIETPIKNIGRKKLNLGHMLPETRQLLDSFYGPYNARMASLMNNNGYLFNR